MKKWSEVSEAHMLYCYIVSLLHCFAALTVTETMNHERSERNNETMQQ